jgi:serine/threonine kinase 32
MRRRSYYPQNQQIISTVTATSSSGVIASRPVTPGDPISGRGDVIGLDSHSVQGLADEYKGHSSEAHHHLHVHDMSEKDHT